MPAYIPWMQITKLAANKQEAKLWAITIFTTESLCQVPLRINILKIHSMVKIEHIRVAAQSLLPSNQPCLGCG